MNTDCHDAADATPAAVPEWRAFIEDKWEALRRQVLGLDPTPPRKLSELSQECQSLAAVTAWYENHGNITRAALRLGTSRRALRDRLTRWRKDNPQLLPPLPAERPKPHQRARGGKSAGQQPESEGRSP